MSRANFHDTFSSVIILHDSNAALPDLISQREVSHSMQKANAKSIFGLKEKNRNDSSDVADRNVLQKNGEKAKNDEQEGASRVSAAVEDAPVDGRGAVSYSDAAYQFRSNDFVVPDHKLDEPEALKNIDLTYYQAKCREVLKNLYDNSFKNHKMYQELRNQLLKNEL